MTADGRWRLPHALAKVLYVFKKKNRSNSSKPDSVSDYSDSDVPQTPPIPKLLLPERSSTSDEDDCFNRLRAASVDTTSEEVYLNTVNRRSRSFDASSEQTSEENAEVVRLARTKRRPSDLPKPCIHCLYIRDQTRRDASASPTADLWEESEIDSVDSSPRTSDVSLDREMSTDSEGSPRTCSGMYLQVPILKPRSTSLDATIIRGIPDGERRPSFDMDMLDVPKQPRATSVDVSLPTKHSACYRALQSRSTGALQPR